MELNDSNLLYLMDKITELGHQDPEGFVSSINMDEDNVTGVSDEDAARYNVPTTKEPLMSIYAAAARDIDTGDYTRYADVDRAPMRTRISNAMAKGVKPSSPFVNSKGQLIIRGHRAGPEKYDESDIKQKIRDML